MIRRISIFLIIVMVLTTMVFPAMNAARAIAMVDDAVIAVVIIALAAMGITFEMSGGINTLTNWLRDQIDTAGIDFSGTQLASNTTGNILVNNRFLTRVRALALYLQSEFGLVDDGEVQVITPQYVVNNYVVYSGDYHVIAKSTGGGYREREVLVSHVDAYFIICKYNSNGYGPLYFDDSSFYGTVRARSKASAEFNEYTFAASEYLVNEQQTGLWYAKPSEASYASNFIPVEGYRYTRYDIDWDDVLRDVYEYGVSGSGDFLDISTGTIDIPDAADIVGMGGILDLPVPWGSSLGSIIGQIPGLTLNGDLQGNVTLDLQAEGSVEDQIDETTTNQPYVSSNPNDYAISGLSDVFPFCIPFDLYNFLECLDAEPEAPAFTWRIYVPNVADEEVEVDLSEFEAVARVIRIMELLLFCVGLAFVTRKLIRG